MLEPTKKLRVRRNGECVLNLTTRGVHQLSRCSPLRGRGGVRIEIAGLVGE